MATFVESLRRLYYDFTYRRSRVRVVPAAPAELRDPPIFVAGVYRSGTTLLRYVLDSHSRIACPAESDFITCLTLLLGETKEARGLGHMGFDGDHVALRLREFINYFFANYARSKGKPRWADKTPEYVDHLELLARVFPEAKFVAIHRHGLDQAHSFTRGGTLLRPALEGYGEPGEDLRIGAVRYWAKKTEKVLAFADEHPDRCTTITYEAMCAAPAEVLRPVFEFLGEAWEPSVLEFYKFDHDIGAEDGRVGATRGFSASGGHYRSWPEGLATACGDIATPLLARLGYATNAREVARQGQSQDA